MRRLLSGVFVVGLALALAGCSDDPAPQAAPTPTPSSAPVPAPAPQVGACRKLDVAAALQQSNSSPVVPCSGPHTAVTVAVGRIDPLVDGHLLAVDAVRVQRQVADTCRRKVDAHVGGSTETHRLSRIQAVWFSPTLQQADDGALWFRCDLVIAGDATTFAPLPARTRGLLARSGALDRYGTCGTAAPAAAGFRRVACSAPHTWRARATIDLPAGTRYLARAAARTADRTCRDVEASRARSVTRLRWSFEWPTKAQWGAGQRYGLCWTPEG